MDLLEQSTWSNNDQIDMIPFFKHYSTVCNHLNSPLVPLSHRTETLPKLSRCCHESEIFNSAPTVIFSECLTCTNIEYQSSYYQHHINQQNTTFHMAWMRLHLEMYETWQSHVFVPSTVNPRNPSMDRSGTSAPCEKHAPYIWLVSQSSTESLDGHRTEWTIPVQ